MTALSVPTPTPRIDPLSGLRRLSSEAPAMTLMAILFSVAIVPTLGAMALDPRRIEGAEVWLKPLHFELSLALYALTLALFVLVLPKELRRGRRFRIYMATAAVAMTLEMLWIGGAAMWGVRSHFNQQGLMGLAYSLAGLFAVWLSSPMLVLGLFLRRAETGLPAPLHLSIWLGLILSFVLTLAIAGTLASGTGHLVGATESARQMWFTGWSRDVGDLRVGHFFATHAMQALPLLGLAVARLPKGREIVIAGAIGWTVLTVGSFVQAKMGLPFLPWLG